MEAEAVAARAAASAANGDLRTAAALYLEAYEAKPLLDWLEAHCDAAGIEFTARTRNPRTPWSIGPAQRLWMYSTIERALVAASQHKGVRDAGEQMLFAGCDHTPRLTARFARDAALDVTALYQSLACRGGFCDCEVLLNAAAEDEAQLASVLASGVVVGDVARFVGLLDDLVVGEAPPRPELGDDAGNDAPLDRLHAIPAEQANELRLLPQLLDGALVGDVLDVLARGEMGDAALRLLLAYPDQKGAMELVVADDARIVAGRIVRREVPPRIAELFPWLAADVAALASLLPSRGACG